MLISDVIVHKDEAWDVEPGDIVTSSIYRDKLFFIVGPLDCYIIADLDTGERYRSLADLGTIRIVTDEYIVKERFKSDESM